MDLTTLSLDELVALAAEKREALSALFALETPTDEQVDEAEALHAEIEAIDAEHDGRPVEVSAAERMAALRENFSTTAPEDEESEEESEEEAEEENPEAEAEEEPAEEEPEPVVAAGTKTRNSTVTRLARKAPRPPAPAPVEETPVVTITAAADSGFTAGSTIDIEQLGEALVQKVRGFAKPSPALKGADIPMQRFPIAKINVPFPEDLTVNHANDAMEVMAHAGRESRLPGGSLVAAGGWCAPSENIYDLCAPETLEGLVSLPEVNVARGGINFTKGPQFSDFYGAGDFSGGQGFLQTEAEAIAGDPKDCYEISCPPFTEVRLDAVGLCIKVPILTEAGYPELTRRVTQGSLTAQQHRISANIISRIVTLSGAARVITGLGSSVSDTLEGLVLLADERREQFRLGLTQSLEVILPFWTKNMFKADLGRRQGREKPVTDAEINAHFAAHNLAPQWVYGWQPLSGLAGAPVEAYPATYDALMYPAGTFVVGKADVINLSAVYDAASLQENLYTGTFTEQGILVAEMCYDSDLVTLPVCNAGRVGAADLTCVVTP